MSSINKLEQYIQFPVIYAEEIDKEIESISREFFQFKEEEKKRLQRFPKRIIESIIGHQSLQLESEDSLLEFVNELYAKDREMVDLYSYVYFINVSKNEMRKFVELFEKDDLTGSLWMRLCERLCDEYEFDLSKRYQNGSKSVRNKPTFGWKLCTLAKSLMAFSIFFEIKQPFKMKSIFHAHHLVMAFLKQFTNLRTKRVLAGRITRQIHGFVLNSKDMKLSQSITQSELIDMV